MAKYLLLLMIGLTSLVTFGSETLFLGSPPVPYGNPCISCEELLPFSQNIERVLRHRFENDRESPYHLGIEHAKLVTMQLIVDESIQSKPRCTLQPTIEKESEGFFVDQLILKSNKDVDISNQGFGVIQLSTRHGKKYYLKIEIPGILKKEGLAVVTVNASGGEQKLNIKMYEVKSYHRTYKDGTIESRGLANPSLAKWTEMVEEGIREQFSSLVDDEKLKQDEDIIKPSLADPLAQDLELIRPTKTPVADDSVISDYQLGLGASVSADYLDEEDERRESVTLKLNPGEKTGEGEEYSIHLGSKAGLAVDRKEEGRDFVIRRESISDTVESFQQISLTKAKSPFTKEEEVTAIHSQIVKNASGQTDTRLSFSSSGRKETGSDIERVQISGADISLERELESGSVHAGSIGFQHSDFRTIEGLRGDSAIISAAAKYESKVHPTDISSFPSSKSIVLKGQHQIDRDEMGILEGDSLEAILSAGGMVGAIHIRTSLEGQTTFHRPQESHRMGVSLTATKHRTDAILGVDFTKGSEFSGVMDRSHEKKSTFKLAGRFRGCWSVAEGGFYFNEVDEATFYVGTEIYFGGPKCSK